MKPVSREIHNKKAGMHYLGSGYNSESTSSHLETEKFDRVFSKQNHFVGHYLLCLIKSLVNIKNFYFSNERALKRSFNTRQNLLLVLSIKQQVCGDQLHFELEQ